MIASRLTFVLTQIVWHHFPSIPMHSGTQSTLHFRHYVFFVNGMIVNVTCLFIFVFCRDKHGQKDCGSQPCPAELCNKITIAIAGTPNAGASSSRNSDNNGAGHVALPDRRYIHAQHVKTSVIKMTSQELVLKVSLARWLRREIEEFHRNYLMNADGLPHRRLNSLEREWLAAVEMLRLAEQPRKVVIEIGTDLNR